MSFLRKDHDSVIFIKVNNNKDMEKRISNTEWAVFLTVVVWYINIASLNHWFGIGTNIVSGIVLLFLGILYYYC